MDVEVDVGVDVEVDVLIVGAGPVGLTAALLLERLGRTVAVVERRDGPVRAPAAHAINARTFEIWRQIGLDVDAIRAEAQDPADAGMVHWVRKLGGEVIASLPYERQGDDQLAVTPTPLRNLSQHRLEPMLVVALAAAGVPVHYGHRWESADPFPDFAPEHSVEGVRSSVHGPDGPITVASRWLLACDGASSPVRRRLGIVPEGPHRIQSFVMVHLAADLRTLVGDHPGVLFWICDAASGGTFVSHGIDREWVYMHAYDPDTEDAESYSPELLDSYERERRPVAQRNAEVSLENALKLIEVPIALGADPDPVVFQANIDATLSDPDGRARVVAAIENQAAHFDLLGLQLGYAYEDGDPSAEETADRARTYVPSSRPGGRLPHGWVRRGGPTCSTLDLIPLDRPVLIAGPDCAVSGADLRMGVDVDDPDGWWSTILDLPDDGALLVRPDQHIAARWTSTPAADEVERERWARWARWASGET